MDSSYKFDTVVVTGGSRGIGLAICEAFLEEGAKNVILLDIKEQLGLETARKLNEKYGSSKAMFIKCDVTTDLEFVFNTILSKFNSIDVLINNAGICDETSIKKTIGINTIATVEWTMKFWNHFRKDKEGNGCTVINVSSVYGFMVDPFAAFYKASKHAVIGFSRTLGHEFNYKQTGVRIITICPGFTKTSLPDDAIRSENFEYLLSKQINFMEKIKWQEADDVSKETLNVFKKADSGTVWCIQEGRPAIEITVPPEFRSEYLMKHNI